LIHEGKIPEFSAKYFKERIPFLKDYEGQYAPDDFAHERMPERVEMLYTRHHENVAFNAGGSVIEIPRVSIISKFVYYPHKIRENTFHHFVIENGLSISHPKGIDDMTERVLDVATRMMKKNLSYSGEIIVSEDGKFDSSKLDEIINKINERLFKLEEFTSEGFGVDTF